MFTLDSGRVQQTIRGVRALSNSLAIMGTFLIC